MRVQQINQRRGVILMVVLALLTLFALVGLTFVLYADAEATAARIAREGESLQRADMDPEEALSLFLGQLIYDVPDTTMTGVSSGLRGHSLARNMYGYNYTTGINVTPYNGVGRLRYTYPTAGTLPPAWMGQSDYNLVNYTWFSVDGFLRDPERYNNPASLRTNPATTQTHPYVGGNPSYTYPDLNNFFLAAVNSQGQVLTPSFHRPWLFNPGRALNDMINNPNWLSTTPVGKYLTPRPRPVDHSGFPAPDDAWGDVKNLVGAPGGNDSIWIDIGAPIMTAPDGTKYKPLFAPLIMDLDNRINVAACGNVNGGTAYASRSNQGWFSSEVNLSQVLNYPNPALSPPLIPAATTEWENLFRGNALPHANTTYYGKYGSGKVPSAPLQLPIGTPVLAGATGGTSSGTNAHVYSQVDLDGRNEMAAGVNTGPMILPTGATAASCFPLFPPGYGSGSTLEYAGHPAAYSVYKSPLYNASNTNLTFRPSDMEALLRPNSMGETAVDTGSSALISNLLRLCPYNLALDQTSAYQRRNWITTISSDLARPGLSPWIYNPGLSPYLVNTTIPSLAPMGTTTTLPTGNMPFPALPPVAPGTASEFSATWQAADAIALLGSTVGRIDLNRPLPPYPHMVSGMTSATITPANARYDSVGGSVMAVPVATQFYLASQARQQFAIDIYLRLLSVTGVPPAANIAVPTAVELAPRRWLAQLAANIVDYIDADEISTAFNFYDITTGLPASPSVAPTLNQVSSTNTLQLTPTPLTIPPSPALPGGNSQLPVYWIFGTEMPRLAISEVLGEYTLPTNGMSPPTLEAGGPFNVNIWVELFNPMPALAAPGSGYVVGPTGVKNTANGSTLQPLDGLAEPLYMPAAGTGGAAATYNTYQIVIANNDISNPTANPYGLWYNAATTAGSNNNVMGMPQQVRISNTTTPTSAICQFAELATNGGMVNTVANPPPNKAAYSLLAGLPAQTYMLVGPNTTNNNDANNDINATNVTAAKGTPANVPWVVSSHMQYPVMFTPPNAFTNNGTAILDNINGVSVLLRRLANPHLPPNYFVPATDTTPATLLYPTLPPNPYITVDYAHGVPLNGYGSDGTKLLSISNPVNKFSPAITSTGLSNVPNVPVGAWFSPNPPSSYGKLQPYASDPSQCALRTTALPGANNQRHTLGAPNIPIASPFAWLVHPDRKLISPMELLHVSGFHPHELTQRFIQPTPTAPAGKSPVLPPNPLSLLVSQPYGSPGQYPVTSGAAGSYFFQHYAPWFDQSRRLYRLFEFVETHDGMSGISPANGRVPGKININTLWDVPLTYNATTTPPTTPPWYPEIYQALYDSTATFSNTPNYTSTAVNLLFQKLLYHRTPGLFAGTPPAITPNGTPTLTVADRPFVGMAAGVSPVTGDSQYPNGMGINRTLLRDLLPDSGALATNPRILQMLNGTPTNPQGAHPYMQMELLNKIYNRLTTRSNVFAAFVTVGFFQVVNPVANPPTLGAEIGLSEGRNVRHRMFAIIDRTNLQVFPNLSSTSRVAAPAATGTATTATIAFPSALSATNATVTGYPAAAPLYLNVPNPNTGAVGWIKPSTQLLPGTQLVIEPGTANEETVVVTAVIPPNPTATPPVSAQITANFLLAHPNPAVTANTTGTYAVTQRGNPGPWMQPYHPRKDPGVVLYYSIID